MSQETAINGRESGSNAENTGWTEQRVALRGHVWSQANKVNVKKLGVKRTRFRESGKSGESGSNAESGNGVETIGWRKQHVWSQAHKVP